jgi:hypothetical protein
MHAMREASRSERASGELRVVFGDDVRLWARPDTRAPATCVLRRGTVVRALQRRRSWTLVEYDAGATADLAAGWVFNKYLRSVTVPHR